MGGGKGGSADQSGMYAAMASVNAANQAYALGEQQLQWSEDVWNQEQPLITSAENAQIAVSNEDLKAMQSQEAFANEQEAIYNQYYAPLEASYVNQAENWASPANTSLVTGQARSGVASAVQQGINTSKEQLEAYGVKPNDPRFAGLYAGANVMGAAAEAGAGTTAAQNLKLQQLALEQGAINTGRGVAGSTSTMTNAATGAGQGSAQGASGSASTAQSNLQAGSNAMTAPVNWFNSGANNMGVYVNAVNGVNSANVGFAQAGAQEMAGLGNLAGSVLGMFNPFHAAKGGPIGYADGGSVDNDDSRIVSPAKSTNRLSPGVPGRSPLPLRPAQPSELYPGTIPPGYRFDPKTQGLRDPNLPSPMAPSAPYGYLPDGTPRAPGMGPSEIPPTVQGMPRQIPILPGREEWQTQPSGSVDDRFNAARPPAPPPALAYPGDAQNAGPTWQSPQRTPVQPLWRSTNMPPPGSEVPVNPQLPVQLRNQMNLAPSTAMAGGGPTQPQQGIPMRMPVGGTPGGPVPVHASPSMGAATDDVDAKLTAGEFVMPKDVSMWKGHEHFVKSIDKARQEMAQFKGRGDIGGEPAHGIPQRPTFVSRPSPVGIPQRRFA